MGSPWACLLVHWNEMSGVVSWAIDFPPDIDPLSPWGNGLLSGPVLHKFTEEFTEYFMSSKEC